MQSQSWHQKEKYEDDAQLDEEQQHQSAEFLFVDFEEACRPGCAGVPKQSRRSEIEQREDETDDKCAEEKVAEENDLFAFHAALWQRRLTPIAQGGSVNRPYLYKQIWVIRGHFLYAGTSGKLPRNFVAFQLSNCGFNLNRDFVYELTSLLAIYFTIVE